MSDRDDNAGCSSTVHKEEEWTVERLRDFETCVAQAFNAGQIAAPVHLSHGNEAQLLRYFAAHHRPGDWVFSTWRSHYHALLTGVPEAEIFAAILAGRSITLCFQEYRFATSAIVGGHLPLAVGVALGLARDAQRRCAHGIFIRNWCWQCDEYALYGPMEPAGCPPKVHCFLGDMAATTGLFHECRRYAVGHDLPINFIIEDNGLSVCTPTQEAWGSVTVATAGRDGDSLNSRHLALKDNKTQTITYNGTRYPHSGANKRVNF